MQDKEMLERQKQFENEYKHSEFFKDKIKTINPEYLDEDEKKIIEKIKNNQEITDDEFRKIFIYISDYDKAENEIKPDEIIEARKTETEIIQTEKELVDFLNNDYIEFKFCPHNMRGQRIQLTIRAEPISDSTIIKTIETHENIFKDYSPEEMEVVNKNARGEKLTRAEIQILNKITNELNDEDNSYAERFNSIKEFICETCYIIYPDGSRTDLTVNLINKFRFNDIVSLYIKLQDVLGLTEDNQEKLFPSS